MKPSKRSNRSLATVAIALMVAVALNIANAPVGSARNARVVSPWSSLSFPANFYPGAMLQLTNGSVMVQDQGPLNSGATGWWLLTPSTSGSYLKGTWKKIASLPAGYGPVNFASAVLPDGRAVIEGGEDNLGSSTWTNKGAIYDPLANTWTPIAPPSGAQWSTIGDAPSAVLANGTFMMGGSGNYTNTTQALLNATNLTWTITGTGKVDANEESGFTTLPSGQVLTVGLQPSSNKAEIYNPVTGAWSDAGTIPDVVVDVVGGEIGPLVLRPNGTVFVIGATGHTAIYYTTTKAWSVGPDFPVINGAQPHSSDGPAAVLPDGTVLIDASPGLYQTPTHFFIFDGTKFTRVTDAPNSANLESNWAYMLVLPTGQVLFNDRFGRMELFTSPHAASAGSMPKIFHTPTSLTRGSSYTFSGFQMSGLTQGVSYGDDYQSATNYPLVRVSYPSTGKVLYFRTFAISSVSVAPHSTSHAQFQVPLSATKGAAKLVVVANGVASAPISVTIH
jgi:hypothetical protein